MLQKHHDSELLNLDQLDLAKHDRIHPSVVSWSVAVGEAVPSSCGWTSATCSRSFLRTPSSSDPPPHGLKEGANKLDRLATSLRQA